MADFQRGKGKGPWGEKEANAKVTKVINQEPQAMIILYSCIFLKDIRLHTVY